MKRGQSNIHALIGVDKPPALSSHDVVSHVRRATHERRVGHAGTLDPAASGVLVLGIGQATRLLGQLTLNQKSYIACISFGRQTTTDDAEGETLREAPVPPELFSSSYVSQYLSSCIGIHNQRPPAYSAISKDGTRAYKAARVGKPLELDERKVELIDAKLLEIDEEHASWTIALTVSKGFYVRSFARDTGITLGTVAHLSHLRRTASGHISLSSCVELSYIDTHDVSHILNHCLDPVQTLDLPPRYLSYAEAKDAACGKPLALGTASSLLQNERCALVVDSKLVGIWQRRGATLRCHMNFPQGIMGVNASS